MKYLRMASKKAGGVSNKKIQLIVVGKSESGKTSVVKMLMQGQCERIPHDDRTVGVDLSEWDLSGEADGLGFSVKDLAGQDAAGVWNQLFLVKRAIYVLVWRVLPRAASQEALRELSEMVSDWLDTLQLRVPGARVILVAIRPRRCALGYVNTVCVRHCLAPRDMQHAVATVPHWG